MILLEVHPRKVILMKDIGYKLSLRSSWTNRISIIVIVFSSGQFPSQCAEVYGCSPRNQRGVSFCVVIILCIVGTVVSTLATFKCRRASRAW